MERTPDGGSGGQRNGIYEVSCRVLLFYKSDADLDTAAVRFRLYVEAMVRVVLATPDLGGVTSGEGTIHAILRRVQFSADSENESTTVHGAAIDWLVGVQSTIGGGANATDETTALQWREVQRRRSSARRARQRVAGGCRSTPCRALGDSRRRIGAAIGRNCRNKRRRNPRATIAQVERSIKCPLAGSSRSSGLRKKSHTTLSRPLRLLMPWTSCRSSLRRTRPTPRSAPMLGQAHTRERSKVPPAASGLPFVTSCLPRLA